MATDIIEIERERERERETETETETETERDQDCFNGCPVPSLFRQSRSLPLHGRL